MNPEAVNRDALLFVHIADAIVRIERYTAGGRESFFGDVLIQDGVIRNLEVIGEAVKNLSEDARARQPAIPWRRIAGLRDFLIHVYFGIDLANVWEVVVNRLPELKRAVQEMQVGAPASG